MKIFKNGNPIKLVAFFLIVVALTCMIAFAASGWQSNEPDADSGNVGEGGDKLPSNDESDENTKGDDPNTNVPVVKPIPAYTHYLTGLEISEEDYYKKAIAVTISSDAPLYGISSAFLTVELPTEDGKTRFLLLTNKATSIGKLGSIAPTRRYISNIAKYFGAILLSYGSDDSFEYDGHDLKYHLDLTQNSGYHYTEYTDYVYTNADLVNALLKNTGTATMSSGTPSAPYSFVGYYDNKTIGQETATNITISFSSGNSTELSYSEEDGKFTMSKNSTSKNDLLNDRKTQFDNVFVLFSSSVTYETEESTQTVIDTVDGGKGYYFTQGTKTNITWSFDQDGNLIFFNEKGEKLVVNRGSSYISFVKASRMNEVKIIN